MVCQKRKPKTDDLYVHIFCTYKVRKNLNIVFIFTGYGISLDMITYFLKTQYSICLKTMLNLSQLEIVIDFSVYCICPNWITYFHLYLQFICMVYQRYSFFTVLDYPCTGVHSRRAPCFRYI